jgi:site-specific recombinase XerD
LAHYAAERCADAQFGILCGHCKDNSFIPSSKDYLMPQTNLPPSAQQPWKLLDRLCDRMRLRNYSYRTAQSSIAWVRRYILFHNKRHPEEMGRPEIESFLTHLAVDRNAAPSTQNQALHAILFLYRAVLEKPIPERINASRAQERRRLPTVLTVEKVQRLRKQMAGVPHLSHCSSIAITYMRA